ncbi:MAG: TolC family protein [Thermoanaerobaculia bacterium]
MRARTTAGLLAFGTLSATMALGQPTPAPAPDPPLTLADLERMALEKNPTLVQASAEIDAARGRAKQAGLLPKPVVGFSADELPLRGGTVRGKEGVFLEQTVPLGGKLKSSRGIFEKEVGEAEANVETQRLRVVNSVRSLYYEAVVAAQRVQVRERLAQLTDEAVAVSRQLFNVGAADRPDVLESEIEARETRLALVAARNQQFHTWRSLAVMVGEPDMKLHPLAGMLDISPPELDRDEAVATLLRDSPQVRRAKTQVERAAAIVDRADRERFPDLFLRAGADRDRERLEGSTRPVGWEASVQAGLSLPLFNRNQGDRAAARANLSRARAEVQRVELALRGRFSGVFEAYLTSLRLADEYGQEILPRAEQAYKLYLDKFREMAAAYPQVLIAQRTLFQTSEKYLNSLEEAHLAAVQIQGLLLVDGLDAPPVPGEMESGLRASELPGAIRSGELPIAVRPPGRE